MRKPIDNKCQNIRHLSFSGLNIAGILRRFNFGFFMLTSNQLYYRTMQNMALICLVGIFIIAMNYSSFTLGGYGLQTPSNISTWIALAVFVFCVTVIIFTRSRVQVSKYFYLYLACVAVLFFPLLYTDLKFLNKEFLVIFSIFASLLFFLTLNQFHSVRFKHCLLKILFISTIIQTVWGLIQYYFLFEPSILFFRPELNIPGGVFLQKNVFSTYLGFGSLIALYFLFIKPEPTKKLIACVGLVLILNAHLTMLAEAKTGRVVPLIAIALYLVFIMWAQKKYLLPIVLMIICVFFSFMPKQWFDVRPGTAVEAPLGIQSFGVRPVVYSLGIDLVLQKPLSGHGIGQLHKQYSLIQGDYIREHPDFPQQEYMGHIHNEPLQWMIQLGVISGFAFIGLFAVWVYGLKTGQLDPYILLLALPFVGHSMLEFPFYHSAPHLLAFVAVLVLAIKKKGKTIKFSAISSAIILPLSALGTYKTIVFMLASLASLGAMVEYKHKTKEVSIEPLTSLRPTSTFSRTFEHEIYQWKLRKAVADGEIPADLLLPFIEWAEEQVSYAPFKLIYIQLTQSYMLAKDVDNAKRVIAEAHHIFPTDEEVTLYYNKLHP